MGQQFEAARSYNKRLQVRSAPCSKGMSLPASPDGSGEDADPKRVSCTFATLFDLAPLPVVIHREGAIVYLNSAAVALLGARNESEALGRPFLDIVDPQFRSTVAARARIMVA